ncbi:MAG TPA: diguanylate cyclase [Desulfotomaculum sp.]|nr:diguanylate cyclase [Desulfotomaculum sp.]
MGSVDLASLTTGLVSTEDPARIGDLVVEAIKDATGATGVELYMVNRSEGMLVCLTDKSGGAKRLPLGQATLPGLALAKRCPVQAGNEVVIPLFMAGREVGVLTVETNESLQAAEREINRMKDLFALALANLTGRQEMLGQWRFLEVLTTLNWLIASNLEGREFCDALHHLIKGLIDFDWMKVLVKNDRKIDVFAFIRDGEAVAPGESLHVSDRALQNMLDLGQPDVVEDLRAVPELTADPVLAAANLRSLLLVPLLTSRGVIGGVCFYSREKNNYGDKDIPLAQQLAGQLATTIENSLLTSEMERKNREIEESYRRLAVLNAVAETLTRSLELEMVLQEVLAKVAEVAGWDAGAVFLRKENEEGFDLSVQMGVPDDYAACLKTKQRDTPGFPRIAFGDRLLVFDAAGVPEVLNPPLFAASGFRSCAVVPLKNKTNVEGMLVLFRGTEQQLNPQEQEVLEAVGNQIGVAVENVRLYQKVKRMAERDALTGLYNRHKFFAVLDTELKRCRRYNSKCVVLLFDADNFKEYNDTFGHLAGDDCLRRIGALIQQTLRETDIAARYGGEEFVVLVVEVGARGGIAVAERLRRVLEAEGQKEPFPTVSIGVAVYPDDAQTAQDLLLTADNALYTAKRLGRNRTVWRGLVQNIVPTNR